MQKNLNFYKNCSQWFLLRNGIVIINNENYDGVLTVPESRAFTGKTTIEVANQNL